MVRLRARLRPSLSPARPKKPPPRAHPVRKAAWIQELFSRTAASAGEAAASSSMTKGAATSV